MDSAINRNKHISFSKKLINSVSFFIDVAYAYPLIHLFYKELVYCGWGRKASGQKAVQRAKKHHQNFLLLEDGFIRSIGLGVEGFPSFSIVLDDIGIFYDATTPSKLENILLSYDFKSDKPLLLEAKSAISLICEHQISKYNHAPKVAKGFFKNEREKQVLIIAQTAGDKSLEYGMGTRFTTKEMIDTAIKENPLSDIYLKIHPDVLSGKKESDIQICEIPKECYLLKEDINPISLLQNFTKVYTKTSQMGFEALLVGCDTVCFGMPFYAGWGVTDDRVDCPRRNRQLKIEEVFAAAYILYSKYYNPITNQKSDLDDTIRTIIKVKNSQKELR
jgi:capsular polysaccharide export protein